MNNHGNSGNQHAAKEKPRTRNINVRTTQEHYEQLKQDAKDANLSLSAYVLARLLRVRVVTGQF